MQLAVEEAAKAAAQGEVPVGAVITWQGQILAKTGNRCIRDTDPTAHAEILAIRQAARQFGQYRLPECSLFVSLEPCTMCAGAISFARLQRVFFAAWDIKGGAVDHGPRFFNHASCMHRPEVHAGLMETEAKELLQAFFQNKRHTQ
ncbi:MAG: nucleoside deaminase [Alphaproteobacteria bacterium]